MSQALRDASGSPSHDPMHLHAEAGWLTDPRPAAVDRVTGSLMPVSGPDTVI